MFGKKGALYIFKKLWFEVAWNVFVADRFLTNRSVAGQPQFVRFPRSYMGPGIVQVLGTRS